MQELEELVALLFMVNRRMRQHCHADSRSLVAFATLQYVTEQGTPTMKEVARFLGVTPSSATSLVRGLVDNGHLERLTDDADRRIIRVRITAQGEKDVAQHLAHMETHLRGMFTDLAPEDIIELTRIFRRVARTAEAP